VPAGRYDETLVYAFDSDGNPQDLLDGFVYPGGDKYLYEVEPEGDLLPDLEGPIRISRAFKAATSKACLHGLIGAQLGQTAAVGGSSPLVLVSTVASAAALAANVQTPVVSQFFGCTPLGS